MTLQLVEEGGQTWEAGALLDLVVCSTKTFNFQDRLLSTAKIFYIKEASQTKTI